MVTPSVVGVHDKKMRLAIAWTPSNICALFANVSISYESGATVRFIYYMGVLGGIRDLIGAEIHMFLYRVVSCMHYKGGEPDLGSITPQRRVLEAAARLTVTTQSTHRRCAQS